MRVILVCFKYFNGLVYYGLKEGIKDQPKKCSKTFYSRHVDPSSISGWYPRGLTS